MKAEAAPRLGLMLLAWLILVSLIAFACSPAVLALAVLWSATPW